MSNQRNEHLSLPAHQHSLECPIQQPDPAIFSETHVLEFLEKVSSEKIQQALTQWVEEISEWAKSNAYLVGHIKMFIEGKENLWLSSTGRRINAKHSRGWSEWFAARFNLSVTVIVFGTSKEALREIAQVRLQACLNCLEFDAGGNKPYPVIRS